MASYRKRTLCSGSCGFFGLPEFSGFCSNCFTKDGKNSRNAPNNRPISFQDVRAFFERGGSSDVSSPTTTNKPKQQQHHSEEQQQLKEKQKKQQQHQEHEIQLPKEKLQQEKEEQLLQEKQEKYNQKQQQQQQETQDQHHQEQQQQHNKEPQQKQEQKQQLHVQHQEQLKEEQQGKQEEYQVQQQEEQQGKQQHKQQQQQQKHVQHVQHQEQLEDGEGEQQQLQQEPQQEPQQAQHQEQLEDGEGEQQQLQQEPQQEPQQAQHQEQHQEQHQGQQQKSQQQQQQQQQEQEEQQVQQQQQKEEEEQQQHRKQHQQNHQEPQQQQKEYCQEQLQLQHHQEQKQDHYQQLKQPQPMPRTSTNDKENTYPTSDNDSIFRPSLGRTACIGDIYDVTHDKLVGVNVFKKPIPNESLYSTLNQSRDSEFVLTSKVSDKMKSLNLEGEATLSIFCGMVSVSGSASYLTERKVSTKAVQCSFVQKIRTCDERINVKDDVIRDCYSTEIGDEGTHVVIGISWGAIATVTLTYENTEDRFKDEIEGKLKTCLDRLKIFSAIGKVDGGGNWLVDDSLAAQEMHLKVYDDILANEEDASYSPAEAMKLIYNLPYRVAETDGGKGKQLQLQLLPLSMLKKHLSLQTDADQLHYEIEADVVKRVEQLFDGIEESREALNDLCTYLEKNTLFVLPQDKNRAKNYQADFELAVSNYCHDLGTLVKKVRSCQEKQFELDGLTTGFQKYSLVSAAKVTEFIASCDPIKEKITLIKAFISDGAQFICETPELNTAKLNYKNQEIYILYFSFLTDRQSLNWGDSIDLFRIVCKSRLQNNTICLAVDTDILPDVMKSESLSPGLKICRMLNGRYTCKDVLEEHQKHASQCTVVSDLGMNKIQYPNSKCVPISFRCPKSYRIGLCEQIEREWFCAKCRKPIEYGFDENFYCDCGYQSMFSFRFKCSSPMHGSDHVIFPEGHLKYVVDLIRPCQELNILVVGETGVGKSTWINAIANYITYGTLDEAKNASLITLIPTEFNITQEAGGKVKQVLISTGHSENERHDKGQSSTQMPRAYTFRHANKLYRIIDTPGIGDSRGIVQDKINMENIMNFVARYNELHAICILMKPNESRLTPTFEFCFMQLLIQFHRSAADNIVFCFTNTSGYEFSVSETLTPLSELLRRIAENQNADIPLKRHTMYAYDNMAYRFICAVQPEYGCKFSVNQEALYSKSYSISRNETQRMLEHIKTLKPHRAKDSISINYARSVVLHMTEPLAMINSTVQQTIEKIAERQKLVAEFHNDEEKLREILMKPIKLVHWKIETDTRIYCKACIVETHYSGDQRLQFVGITPNVMNEDPFVVRDVTYLKKDEKGKYFCDNCDQNYKKAVNSMWLVSYTEEKEEEDVTVATDLKEKLNKRQGIEQQIAVNQKLKTELELERDTIVKASTKFAYFLNLYSIAPYNDATEKYLKQLIDKEEKMGVDDKKRKSYDQLLGKYLVEKDVLSKAVKNAPADAGGVQAADVIEIVQDLKSLRHYGKDIEKALVAAQKANFGDSEEDLEYHFHPFGPRHRYQQCQRKYENVLKKSWNYIVG